MVVAPWRRRHGPASSRITGSRHYPWWPKDRSRPPWAQTSPVIASGRPLAALARSTRLNACTLSSVARISVSSHSLQLGSACELSAMGSPPRTQRCHAAARGNRVTYARAGLSEWYTNGPLGLEQGFTVESTIRTPEAAADGRDRAPWQRTSHAHCRRASRRAQATRWRWLPLLPWPTRERCPGAHVSQPARAATTTAAGKGRRRGARYPLRIDPFIQQGAKLTGSGETGGNSASAWRCPPMATRAGRWLRRQLASARRGYSRARARPGPSRGKSSRQVGRSARPNSGKAWRSPPTATPR